MDAPDTLLIQKALAGDTAAFDELVKRHRDHMHRQLYSRCMDTEQIEDTVQETFVQAYRALGQFKGLSAFSTWLYRIAHNICLRKRQQARRAAALSLDEMAESGDVAAPREVPDPSESPEQTLLSRELRDAMDREVANLPDSWKKVFILRDVEDLSTAEVSEALGISEAAVKARLHRARARLKQQLRPYLTVE
ncbi:MAG TPA: sigma-70 family RNA polymerase sigma factor [Armatimonadota bacterium]|nr:sigma-70 family RNA polymerase sigma factor [Armatimonadota bacterium]